jgi:hypothetical protein
MDLHIGALVEHRSWGRGKILALRQPNAEAYFPSLASEAAGPTRMVRLAMLSLSAVQSDPVLDQVEGRRPGSKAGARVKTPPKRPEHNLDQAIEWFQREYPGGFADERFVKHEVSLKRAAQQLFADKLGNGAGQRLLDSGNFAEIGTLLDAVYRTTKIPSRLELAAIHKGLKESAAAAHLLEGLFALLATPNAQTFARLADGVAGLPAPSKGPHVQTWSTVTILPFLADPTRFIVTKSEIGKQVAGRMGRDLVFSTAVKWDTYDRVLDMSRTLLQKLAPLGATDMIDVQSFTWVTRKLS